MRRNSFMNVCYVTSECFPFVKTGGLADVSGSLPLALSGLGCHVKLFLPLYKSINKGYHKLKQIPELDKIQVEISGKKYFFKVWYGKLKDLLVEVYFIDCPEFFDREQVYTNDPDEDKRFILFQHAVLMTLQKLKWHVNVIHCNDWQTSLIPVYLKKQYSMDKLFSKVTSLLTIHNLAYQGDFPNESSVNAGFLIENVKYGSPFEFYGKFNFLKAGISFADVITTVSPTYASETQTPEFGCGLDSVLSERKSDYFGILNGIDTDVWNPEKDSEILANYNFETFNRKKLNKVRLLKEVNLFYDESKFVIGIVSRLDYQKGFDILFPVLEDILKLNVQMVVLGKGDSEYEQTLKNISEKYPDKFYSYIGYDNKLSHLITSGSDLFLMPSRYEPCGLNQMYSLNYGTIPIVRKTGGLADTVKDVDEYPSEANGISFEEYEPEELLQAIKRAIELISNSELRMNIIKKGMSEDFSWTHSAQEYLKIYQKYLKH